MSRAKLKDLGIDLPIFPTSTVGSFPKPAYLVEELERRATAFWIKTQEEIGLDVLVDGEMYRGDMVAYFSELMPGFEQSGLVRSYGNRYYPKPIIVGEVQWPGPM